MRVIRVDDVDAYLALVGPFLRAREAEHNLALGLLGRLRVEPRLYGFDPTFVVVEQAGDIVGCLLRTPPHGVVLSRFEDLAGVDAVAAEVIDIAPGATGRRRPGGGGGPVRRRVVALDRCPGPDRLPAARPLRGGSASRASRVRPNARGPA